MRITKNFNSKLQNLRHQHVCDKGAYQLFIELTSDALIKVGALGNIHFPAGCYVYTGSAMNRISTRLARHLKSDKSLHWHIDYLLAHKCSKIKEIHMFPSRIIQECQLNQTLRQELGAQPFAPGFGASDCSHGCVSHLSYVRSKLSTLCHN